jgi:hypothetical protein
MDQVITRNLEDVARAAAAAYAGEGAEIDVTVEEGVDWTEEESVFFSFRVKKGRDYAMGPGEIRHRLKQSLLVYFDATGDERHPYVRSLIVSD